MGRKESNQTNKKFSVYKRLIKNSSLGIIVLYTSENGTYLGMDLGGTNFRIVRVDMKDGEATTNTTYFDLNKQLLSGPCDKVRVSYLLTTAQLAIHETSQDKLPEA